MNLILVWIERCRPRINTFPDENKRTTSRTWDIELHIFSLVCFSFLLHELYNTAGEFWMVDYNDFSIGEWAWRLFLQTVVCNPNPARTKTKERANWEAREGGAKSDSWWLTLFAELNSKNRWRLISWRLMRWAGFMTNTRLRRSTESGRLKTAQY